MDRVELEAFIAIAETGGFVRAGDALGLSQSVISKRLQRLESGLGTVLVNRTNRTRIRLTRAGALFLPEAQATMARMAQTERIGRNLARGAAGPIRIGYVFSAALSGLVSDVAARLAEALPELRQEFKLAETPQQLRDLAAGQLDMGLVRPRFSYPEGTTGRIILRDPLIVGVAARHRLAGKATVACADLDRETLIIPQFDEEVGLIEAVHHIRSIGRLGDSVLTRTGDFITAAALAAADRGVVVAPRSLVRLALPNLVYRPFSDLDITLDLALVQRSDMADAQARAIGLALVDPALGAAASHQPAR